MQPNLVALAAEDEAPIAICYATSIERDPAERASGAPAQPRLIMLTAGLVILDASAHRRVRMQVEALLGAARDQLAEVVAREPLAAIACRLHLGLVTVVPGEVNGLRLGVEAPGVLVLDAIAIRELHIFYLSFADVLA